MRESETFVSVVFTGLLNFVKKLKVAFYRLHPYEVPYKPRVSSDEVRKNFKAFDPIPSTIKNIADTSRSLLQELNTLHINIELLKTREAKALAELKHFLEHSFGNVYDFDYYSGGYTTMLYISKPRRYRWRALLLFNTATNAAAATGAGTAAPAAATGTGTAAAAAATTTSSSAATVTGAAAAAAAATTDAAATDTIYCCYYCFCHCYCYC